MTLQPLDQAHSWPTEPDLPPEPALSGVRTWILGKTQPVASVDSSLCVPDLSGKMPGKLSRASFRVDCALQLYIMEKIVSRPTPAARLRLGPGNYEALSPVLCWEMRAWKYNQEISNKSFLYFTVSYSKCLEN